MHDGDKAAFTCQSVMKQGIMRMAGGDKQCSRRSEKLESREGMQPKDPLAEIV